MQIFILQLWNEKRYKYAEEFKTILKFVAKDLQNKSIHVKLETASALSIIVLIIGWNILIIELKSCGWFPEVPVYNCFVTKMQDESQWPAVSEGSIIGEVG